MFPAETYVTRETVELGYVSIRSPRALGIESALEALRTQVPDLDRTSIACSRWIDSPASFSSFEVWKWLAVYLPLAIGVGTGVAWLALFRLRIRNRRMTLRVLSMGRREP